MFGGVDMVAGFWVWWWHLVGWVAMGLLGLQWVLGGFYFVFFYFGFLVPVGFCWAEGSGGMVVIVCLVVAGARG